jgi:hypothetical protein
MSDPKVSAGAAKGSGPVRAAVIGEDALDTYTLIAKPAQGADEEHAGRRGALVGKELAVNQSGGIVDGQMQELPAIALGRESVLTLLVARRPVTRPNADSTELFDIEVEQPTWLGEDEAASRRPLWLDGNQPESANRAMDGGTW